MTSSGSSLFLLFEPAQWQDLFELCRMGLDIVPDVVRVCRALRHTEIHPELVADIVDEPGADGISVRVCQAPEHVGALEAPIEPVCDNGRVAVIPALVFPGKVDAFIAVDVIPLPHPVDGHLGAV